MLNFISSDYGVLEPFEESSVAVRTIRAMYIIIITILFLNILIAMLNLKIKRADRNAQNLYHLQMALLQVEIELGLLSSSERTRRDWFPTWFNYSMTKSEKRVWDHYVETNPLKWTEENDFGEDEDHAPQMSPKHPSAPVAEEASFQTAGFGEASAKSGAETVGSSANGAGKDQPDDERLQDGTDDANLVDLSDPSPATQNEAANKSLSTNPTCIICGRPGKRCTSCLLIAYCGKEHQKQDWTNHRTLCKGKQKHDG